MRQAQAAVPGKLMIAGEYAVLRTDGTALAVAVGRLVDVALRTPASPDGPPAHRLEAFGRAWPVDGANEGLAGFAAAALEAAEGMWQATPRQDIALSVYGQVAGVKVGLGTSAAVTVATLRAALASAGLVRAPAEVAAVARAVHRERQGGQGSGYDVTSIAHGGCIAYHRSPDRGERLDWPHGLAAAAFFTGEAAPTAAALDRLGRIGPALDGIRAAAVELVELWPSAPPVRLLEAIGRCESALEAAAAYEPALLPPAVQRLRQFLHRHGLVARTSGAGGGDCVLGFGAAGAVQAAATAWQSEGGVVVARLPADLAPVEDHAFR